MLKFLNSDLVLNFQDLKIIIPVVVGLLSFLFYWFLSISERFVNAMKSYFGDITGQANAVIISKVIGGIIMGCIPIAAYLIAFPETKLQDFGLGYNENTIVSSLVIFLLLGGVMSFLAWKNAKKPETLEQYPLIRAEQWTKRMMTFNLISWGIYLLGYEMLFRGILFFPLVSELGLWPAIAINVAIYSSTHIGKGLTETIGSIPLSILFCLISLHTGNILTVFLVHLVMAYTNSISTFINNPKMNFTKE